MSKCLASVFAAVVLQSSVVVANGQIVDTPATIASEQVASGQVASGQVASGQVAVPREQRDHEAFFRQKILPVLVSRCYECHSRDAAQLEGGLRLDSRRGVRQGGDSGPAVVPGSPAQSLLLSAMASTDSPMPPDEPLAAEVIADFRTWIVAGAADPRAELEELPTREPDYTESRKYWAFQPVGPQPVPQVRDKSWCRSPIDHFILAKLESDGIAPTREASPEKLLRRVTFDLTGLPPTPQQIEAFANGPSDQAYQQIVDDLLDSPHHGERQAQHWLDVIRYAETEGFEYDRLMPDIWRFRDYVIAAFNSDMPYNQFLMEQIAGDELGDEPSLRIAAGFHRLGAVRRNAGNQAVASSRNEVLTERTDIIGSAVLGLTIGCARCHDHKFDPIPQRDYYRLQAFMAASHEDDVSLRDGADHERLAALKSEIDAKILKLKGILANLDGDEEMRVKAEIAELETQLPPPGPAICSVKNDWEDSAPIHLLRRGSPELPGPAIGMRTPGVLSREDGPELPFETTQPRTRLALDLVDPKHPLTSRVIVNRVWQQHFGTGLVSTPNDFGRNGSPPSHPELLDYLAERFVSSGWHFKALHREIVTSSVYRQASKASASAEAVDPNNRRLSHFPRRRLSGEEIRDAMLSISATLNPAMGGPSVVLPVEKELVDQLYKPSQWEVSDDVQQHHRRSIYLLAKRNLRLPFMEVFDQPSSQTSCAVREQSTHARQSLELLNGPIANELAAAFARRLTREMGSDSRKIVRHAFRLVTAREPLSSELDLSQEFLEEVGLDEFALAMFNLNAFLYVD